MFLIHFKSIFQQENFMNLKNIALFGIAALFTQMGFADVSQDVAVEENQVMEDVAEADEQSADELLLKKTASADAHSSDESSN
jgi:hypothetical protein